MTLLWTRRNRWRLQYQTVEDGRVDPTSAYGVSDAEEDSRCHRRPLSMGKNHPYDYCYYTAAMRRALFVGPPWEALRALVLSSYRCRRCSSSLRRFRRRGYRRRQTQKTALLHCSLVWLQLTRFGRRRRRQRGWWCEGKVAAKECAVALARRRRCCRICADNEAQFARVDRRRQARVWCDIDGTNAKRYHR